jgi:hypothetical protein
MRSVFRNKIIEEGFEIRSVKKLPNIEKQRVKEVYSSNNQRTKTLDGKIVVTPINKDTAEYYDKILRQEDENDLIGRNILPGDSVAYAVSETIAGMDFENYLLVIYKKKLAPLEYIQRFPKSSTAMMSQITLINTTAIEILANGIFFNPQDLLSLGYWAWSEKIAMMLPFDYQPD